jgi:glycosyltransferase involved in cell wall biosynthesis
MRVALIHDWLNGMRGGEKVLELLCELYPEAEIFTLFYEPDNVSELIASKIVNVSPLQRLPWARKAYRSYLPLYPWAIERFRLQGFDLVISTSHCAAKGVRVPAQVRHICYCLTPMRYIWDMFDVYFPRRGPRLVSSLAMRLLVKRLRRWDVATAQRIDFFIAISQHIAKKIFRYYSRNAAVIYPPVDTELFTPGNVKKSEQYLIVSALVPYKRIDLAICAFNELGFPLVIVGEGPEAGRLRAIAKENITFLGWVTNERLRHLYRESQALIFSGEEDFGLVPVEAQACGTPVIAYKKGGVLESVVDGVTGCFFEPQTAEALRAAVEQFAPTRYECINLRTNAERFSRQRCAEQLREFFALHIKGKND